jgi:Ca2+-binding EF-hand superfamily protein
MRKTYFTVIVLASVGMCSLAFAFKDKDGHAHFSPPQIMQQQLFKQMDTNQDGLVSENELQAFVKTGFAKIDTNQDGQVTPEEANKAHHVIHIAMHDGMRVHFKQAFAMADENKDGALDQREAKLLPVPITSMHFAEIDTNQDQRITLSEVEQFMSKRHPTRQ